MFVFRGYLLFLRFFSFVSSFSSLGVSSFAFFRFLPLFLLPEPMRSLLFFNDFHGRKYYNEIEGNLRWGGMVPVSFVFEEFLF